MHREGSERGPALPVAISAHFFVLCGMASKRQRVSANPLLGVREYAELLRDWRRQHGPRHWDEVAGPKFAQDLASLFAAARTREKGSSSLGV